MVLADSHAHLLLQHCKQNVVQAPETALAAAKRALKSSNQDSAQNVQILLCMGHAYYRLGQYEKALHHLNKAYAKSAAFALLDIQPGIHNALGMCLYTLGHYDSALDHLEQAIEAARDQNDLELLISTQIRLANQLFEIGEHDHAEHLVTEVAGFDPDLFTDQDRIEMRLLKAQILLSHVHFKEAEIVLNEVEEAIYRCSDTSFHVLLLALWGRNFRLQGKLEESVSLLNSLVIQCPADIDGADASMICVELAKALFSLDQPQQAMQTVIQGLEQINPPKYSPLRIAMLEQIAYGHGALGNFEAQAKSLQEILNLERSSAIRQIKDRLRNRTLKRKQDQERLRHELQVKENLLLKDSRDRLNLVNDFAHQITNSLTFELLGQRLFQLLKQNLDVHFISLMIVDEESEMLCSGFAIDMGEAREGPCIPLSMKSSLNVQAIDSGQPYLLSWASESDLQASVEHSDIPPRTGLFLPLTLDDRIQGVLSVQSAVESCFSLDEINLLVSISRFVSVATSNILSLEAVKQLNQQLTLEKKTIESAHKRIEYLAYHDSLTGLPNRQALDDDVLQKTLNGSDSFTLVYIDLDGFKPINDHYGHLIGDMVLVETAKRFQRLLPEADRAFRVGGDEFVLLISNPTTTEQLKEFLSQLLNEIRQPVNTRTSEHFISASMGVAFYPENGTSLDELMNFADLAMYQVKRNGKSGIKL